MKTLRSLSSFCLTTTLFAAGLSLGACDLPDIDVSGDGDTDGDADGGSGDDGGDDGGGRGGSKGFEDGGDEDGGDEDGGAGDEGGADETGGGDGAADDGAADDGAADDGAADDGGELPSGEACVAYCQTELTCDSFYEDAATCEAECSAGAAEAGACGGTHDALYACVGALDCESFMIYWQAVELVLEGQDPGEFPCAQQLVDFAVCLDGGDAGA